MSVPPCSCSLLFMHVVGAVPTAICCPALFITVLNRRGLVRVETFLLLLQIILQSHPKHPAK